MEKKLLTSAENWAKQINRPDDGLGNPKGQDLIYLIKLIQKEAYVAGSNDAVKALKDK